MSTIHIPLDVVLHIILLLHPSIQRRLRTLSKWWSKALLQHAFQTINVNIKSSPFPHIRITPIMYRNTVRQLELTGSTINHGDVKILHTLLPNINVIVWSSTALLSDTDLTNLGVDMWCRNATWSTHRLFFTSIAMNNCALITRLNLKIHGPEIPWQCEWQGTSPSLSNIFLQTSQ
jgi:hypothetical protein